MATQPVPDNFYYIVFFSAFLLLLTERAWHLMLLCTVERTRGPFESVGNRHLFMIAGMLPSTLTLVALLTQYTPHQIQLGLTYAYNHVGHVLGVAMWAIVIIHVVTIPLMLIFAIWLDREPRQHGHVP
jgi:hypothetical protein